MENLMNLALWVIAGLLALVALTGGMTKVFIPKEKLAAAPGGDGPQKPASASSRPSAFLSSSLRSA
jgi:hypothetical protein